MKWGRGIFDNLQRFLQFHLTVNAVALLVTLGGVLTADAATNGKPPFNPVRHIREYPVTPFVRIDPVFFQLRFYTPGYLLFL